MSNSPETKIVSCPYCGTQIEGMLTVEQAVAAFDKAMEWLLNRPDDDLDEEEVKALWRQRFLEEISAKALDK